MANAADEVLVDAFLRGEIPYPLIAEGIAEVLAEHKSTPVQNLESIHFADNWARGMAEAVVARRARSV